MERPWQKSIFEEMVMLFPKFMSDTKLRIQKAQRTPNNVNIKSPPPQKHTNLGISYPNTEQKNLEKSFKRDILQCRNKDKNYSKSNKNTMKGRNQRSSSFKMLREQQTRKKNPTK